MLAAADRPQADARYRMTCDALDPEEVAVAKPFDKRSSRWHAPVDNPVDILQHPACNPLTCLNVFRLEALLARGSVQGTAMDGDKSDFYQRKADEFRAAADRMRLTNARLQLLWMARKFERLAERIGGREQERQAAD